MNLSCSSRMIKYLMFGFNLFFVISGIIIIAVGAAVKTVYTEYAEFLDNQYFTLPNMLIATGAFIFMVSFFGCCGAVRESWIMLGIFSILLCIIFIFEFASGIAGYVLRNKTVDFLDSTLRNNLVTYNNTHDIWDLIQNSFQCCGVENYTDWQDHLGTKYALPISCCPALSGATSDFHCNSYIVPSTVSTVTPNITATTANPTTASPITTTPTTVSPTTMSPTTIAPTTTNTSNPTNRRKREVQNQNEALEADVTVTTIPPTPSAPSSTPPYPTGCKYAFGGYIKKHAVQIGGCALGLAFIQVLGIVFSCHLVRQLKNGYYST